MDVFKARVGNHETAEGRAFLQDRSPLFFADRIVRPLLIAQGANDPRVKQAESDQIVEAMKENGIPVTYVLYPDEGHGFARPVNRMSFYAVTDAFLGQCLGGRYQPLGEGPGRLDDHRAGGGGQPSAGWPRRCIRSSSARGSTSCTSRATANRRLRKRIDLNARDGQIAGVQAPGQILGDQPSEPVGTRRVVVAVGLEREARWTGPSERIEGPDDGRVERVPIGRVSPEPPWIVQQARAVQVFNPDERARAVCLLCPVREVVDRRRRPGAGRDHRVRTCAADRSASDRAWTPKAGR